MGLLGSMSPPVPQILNNGSAFFGEKYFIQLKLKRLCWNWLQMTLFIGCMSPARTGCDETSCEPITKACMANGPKYADIKHCVSVECINCNVIFNYIIFQRTRNIFDVLWYLKCTVFGHGSPSICKLMVSHWLPNRLHIVEEWKKLMQATCYNYQ